MKQCENCLAPIESDTGTSATCDACIDIQWDMYQLLQKSPIFGEEMDAFLKERKKVLFAYSWWLDSTVVLHKLNQECKNRLIQLFCFTVDHGYKWNQAYKNIDNIIKFEELENQHTWIDIKNKQSGEKENIKLYSECIQQNMLPCGPTCNKIIDSNYRRIMDLYNEDTLITGWDTPKFNKRLGRYSILREKPEFTVLRGGLAFWMDKESNKNYLNDNQIPRENPWCGWYDTDCLIPWTVLRNLVEKQNYSYNDICKDLPQIIWYLSERVRRWIIDKEDALDKIEHLDIANDSSYHEAMKIAHSDGK